MADRRQKSVWQKAAAKKLMAFTSYVGLIALARTVQTTVERLSTHLEVYKKQIKIYLRAEGLVESADKRSFALLVPDLKVGPGVQGEKRYSRFLTKHGPEETGRMIQKITRIYPATKVQITVEHNGKSTTTTESIPVRIQVSYVFVGKGTTEERLDWTEDLGNKIKVYPGPPSLRAQAGKLRKGQQGD